MTINKHLLEITLSFGCLKKSLLPTNNRKLVNIIRRLVLNILTLWMVYGIQMIFLDIILIDLITHKK